MDDSLGVYISVPFCKAKCSYCNFASGVFAAEQMQGYVDRLCGEISVVRVRAAGMRAELPERVDTIYFGGGTPCLLEPRQMQAIFETLRDHFLVDLRTEITLECAPGQVEDGMLNEMLRLGMNRVSFGVQSFVDREAAAVGRLHTGAMCRAAIDRMRAAGVAEISVDLIAGLPHQTEESWRYSLDQVLESAVPHASVYMLEIDEDSRLGREVRSAGTRYGAGEVPSDDLSAEWYGMACERFGRAGLGQYEISNFARAGHASRHNVKYWRREPYVGFGLDAHSMLRRGGANGSVRFANSSEMDGYLTARTAVFARMAVLPKEEEIGAKQAFEETLFLGLRMNVGVSVEGLRMQFGTGMVAEIKGACAELAQAGLLEQTEGFLRLTERGRMVSNEVFERLLLPVAAA